MSLYIAEWRLKFNDNAKRRLWRPCPNFMPGCAGHDPLAVAAAIKRLGMHDNCEYRVVRYVRAKR